MALNFNGECPLLSFYDVFFLKLSFKMFHNLLFFFFRKKNSNHVARYLAKKKLEQHHFLILFFFQDTEFAPLLYVLFI